MMNLKIVYPLSVSRVNQDGSPYEFTENRFFDQTKLFVDYQRIDSGYVAKDDDNYYLIPDEAGIEINPEMHKFGNPDINEAYKRTENVSDYTKAYAAFGKDRSLDYSAQIDKDLLDTNTENILGVSLVKVDENYQPTQVMPSVIGPGEQKIPTNNALLKETLDLIRSHIANKSNDHAIESIVGLSSSLNQLVESISSVNTTANNSLEIAEGAATAAGEAAQSINEHASSTTNPHPANTTQSFAEVVITPLKSDTAGGSILAAVYNWFKGIFPSLVDGSVKSYIIGLLTVVKDLATRVGLLEDNSYLDRFKISTKHLLQYEYFNAGSMATSAVNTQGPVINRINLLPFSVSDSITVDLARIRIATGATGGKMRIGIYEGNPFYPYTRLWQSDEILLDAAGVVNRMVNI